MDRIRAAVIDSEAPGPAESARVVAPIRREEYAGMVRKNGADDMVRRIE